MPGLTEPRAIRGRLLTVRARYAALALLFIGGLALWLAGPRSLRTRSST